MALQPKWDARPHRPPARRTDTFFKSDNNTLRQILAEGKNFCQKNSFDVVKSSNLEMVNLFGVAVILYLKCTTLFTFSVVFEDTFWISAYPQGFHN